MEDVFEQYEDLKKVLNEQFFQEEDSNEFSVTTIMSMDDLEPELKKALILMYSSSKAQHQAIKNHNFRNLTELVDLNYKATLSFAKKFEEHEKKLNSKKTFNLVNVPKSAKIGGGVILAFSVVWVMFTVDSAAAKATVDFLSKFIPSSKGE